MKIFRFFVAFALVWLAMQSAPNVFGVVPAPDGGYPNGNTAEGQNALENLTTGVWNTATGFQALFSDTTGNTNTAMGFRALYNNITGNSNTATGFQALLHDHTGSSNTANGYNALLFNDSGHDNTATGKDALHSNVNGNYNAANGVNTLFSNTTGGGNTANGFRTLFSNTTGGANTANGIQALYNNTTASNNTADGFNALVSNTTGDYNTASGVQALYHNTTGSNNIALGVLAGLNLTTGNNNIAIGSRGVVAEANTIRIGRPEVHTATYIAGISGATVANGVTVIVDPSGHLGTIVSSQRFKADIKPMGNASEAILALRPVSFHYKKDIDRQGIPEFGLVAEEVEKVNPALVIRDTEGKPHTVRYEQVNAMLLNEFLKEHRAFVEQQQKVEEQGATIARQQKQIDALAAGLQKVSAQLAAASTSRGGLEVSKSAPQTLLNNR